MFVPFLTAKKDAWMKLHESPLEHCPVVFHWKHSPTFLSALTFLPFFFDS